MGEFVLLFALLILANVTIFVDATVLHNNLSEKSFSQFLQSYFILMSSAIFALGAAWFPFKRGYLALVAILFACMFIRENDAVFDLVWHGFWIVPALSILLVGGWYIARNRHTLLEPILSQSNGRYSALICAGFLIIVVFSRLFGTGSFWEAVMGSNYNPDFKSIIQEGIELLGYVLIFHGSCMTFLGWFADHTNLPRRFTP
ncbi:hypothetical protein [Parasedimentitalea denitrificans]|uniref:hypothetical protein n=1 Tax=Parasedimentitalea denitrificans TaxID=2211118 RepID=UPI00197F36AD|nr:hypothetical protein [Sedimentitalea sp. CY04]